MDNRRKKKKQIDKEKKEKKHPDFNKTSDPPYNQLHFVFVYDEEVVYEFL